MTDTEPPYLVRTAMGERTFSPADGHTLPHEHVLLDLRSWWTGPGPAADLDPPGLDLPDVLDQVALAPEATCRENLVLSDWYLAAKELRAARSDGLQLLVDLTVRGLDPRPDLVVRAADLAGVDVVLPVGRYVAAALDAAERARSVDDLAEEWTRQVVEGVGGRLVPGIIGEIGTGERIEDAEAISLRAAARVQAATGLAINIHVHPYTRQALSAVRLLEDEGADLSRVAVSHLDGEIDVQWLTQVLKASCYVEMDQFGTGPDRLVQGRGYPSDVDRVQAIAELCQRGWGERLLVSHDLCHQNALLRHKGHGYGHIGRTVLPLLEATVGEAMAHQILAVNPLTLLAIGRSAPSDTSGHTAGAVS